MPDRTKTRAESPVRLAKLLVAVRVEHFGKNQAEMAKSLDGSVRRDVYGVPVVSFSQSVVNSLENRQIGFRFAHIEAYARLLGIPTGILLLVSLYSTTSQPRRDLADLRNVLQTLISVCESSAAAGRSLTVYDLAPLCGIAIQDPERATDVVTEDDLASANSALERLAKVKALTEKRGLDPLSAKANEANQLSLFRSPSDQY
jgi:hypothetical protein